MIDALKRRAQAKNRLMETSSSNMESVRQRSQRDANEKSAEREMDSLEMNDRFTKETELNKAVNRQLHECKRQ